MDNKTKDTLVSAAKGYLAGLVIEKGLEFIFPGLDIANGVIEIAGAVWCAYRSEKRRMSDHGEIFGGSADEARNPLAGAAVVIPALNHTPIPSRK